MARLRHILVIGAGLAGLAAAVAASAAGLRVDVYETLPAPAHAAAAPRAHVDLVPNLLRDLVALGLGPACVQHGFPYQGMAMVDGQGRTLFELATPRLAGPAWPCALGMVYGDLLSVLRQAAQAQGVHLHWGQPVASIDALGQAAAAHAAPERLTLLASGPTPPPQATPDLPPLPLRGLPQQWCHALLPRPAMLERSTWIAGSAGLKALLVPVSLRQAGIAVMQPAQAPGTPAALRTALSGQGPLLQALAAQWHDDTPTLVRPVRTGLLPGDWHAGGVLRIGHSAHVLPPHFGQAAAQVVEDAVVLGDLLRQGLDREALLQAFTQRRGPRARAVHALTVQAARWDLQPRADTDLPALAAQLAPLVATAA
jgi:2-polyprenyl-6-methoxyphenol hydroxylase-like FAD-dependent oxidoreductase